MKNIEAVFLDRDGTGGGTTMHYPGEFELFPYTALAINRLKEDRIPLFSFTNQPGISKGLATIKDFQQELTGFGFDDVYVCPPPLKKVVRAGSLMLMEARHTHDLTLNNCVVIGDRWTDMLAASKAGCIKILVRTGAGEMSLRDHRDESNNIRIDYIASDLKDAISWLYSQYSLTGRA
ncbi:MULTISPECIES: HAD-IIIA family hydrolase [unclassified Exiguobacterium]|uniref:HAD-IIIA family hydrolase n=1 Tax=unclassified Exiguobacterium TaxID=2644629 RepID=UPI001BE79249|nr:MULTISPECIES: HAD-IIIA family hydrolase [unclassified Exiguobacterium]